MMISVPDPFTIDASRFTVTSTVALDFGICFLEFYPWFGNLATVGFGE
jgi:hypothetical protein